MARPSTLGARIAQARRELGVREHRDVTQLDLARAVGATSASISEWEADKKVPREASLVRLAKALGVTPAYLRYGEGSALPPGVVEDRGQTSDQFFAQQKKAAHKAAPKKRRA